MQIPHLTTFALEGPDKVGKATQSSLLLHALEGLKLRSHLIEVPSKNHACYDKIYDMLRRREDGSAPAHDYPGIFQAYQAANRFHIQEDLRRIAKEGDTVVVFDRWHVSSLVYGRVAGMDERELEVISEGMLVPDITFILDGHSFDRPEQGDDAYEDDDDFQSCVRGLYAVHQTSVGGGVVEHVSANHPKEIVHQQILTTATKALVACGLL